MNKSCDNCNSQEDSHYCLLHSKQIKNMNLHVCDDWREVDGWTEQGFADMIRDAVRNSDIGDKI